MRDFRRQFESQIEFMSKRDNKQKKKNSLRKISNLTYAICLKQK